VHRISELVPMEGARWVEDVAIPVPAFVEESSQRSLLHCPLQGQQGSEESGQGGVVQRLTAEGAEEEAEAESMTGPSRSELTDDAAHVEHVEAAALHLNAGKSSERLHLTDPAQLRGHRQLVGETGKALNLVLHSSTRTTTRQRPHGQ
jgi:hypothetical protein